MTSATPHIIQKDGKFRLACRCGSTNIRPKRVDKTNNSYVLECQNACSPSRHNNQVSGNAFALEFLDPYLREDIHLYHKIVIDVLSHFRNNSTYSDLNNYYTQLILKTQAEEEFNCIVDNISKQPLSYDLKCTSNNDKFDLKIKIDGNVYKKTHSDNNWIHINGLLLK